MRKTGKISVVALIACIFFALCALSLAACAGDGDEIALISIEITKNPTKVVYVDGDRFDPAGLEVTAHYSNSESRALGSEEYTVRAPSMSVPTGRFKDTQSVKVTYAENGVEKTASFNITVTNSVKTAEIVAYPDKTEYYPGEYFDPTGLKVNASLENGSQSEIAITKNNASFSVTEITADTDTVTVTIGGFSFEVSVTVKNGVYIEAEKGLLNGNVVGGNNYRELSLEEISENVVKLYQSHLVVAYKKKLADIKRAELIAAGESDVDGALNAYLDSDEYFAALDGYSSTDEFVGAVAAYKDGSNDDIAEWDYKADIAHYRAYGDAYLGDLNKGDEISFVFEAEKACAGSIAFRLSSTYLLKDDGNWTPIEMGGVRFNELCEFYVNGVKADIANSVQLEGGKTEDGSANTALWTNWKEVQFDGIAFAAGRNVILLKIRNHNLVSPAHAENKAVPNIDSLIVSTNDDVKIGAYDNTASFTYNVSSVEIAGETGVAINVKGNISVGNGYVADLFNVKLGSELAVLELVDGKFVATVDVESFDINKDGYAVTVCGKTLQADGIEINTDPVSVYREYKLDTKDFVKLIISGGLYSVQLTEAEFATPTVSLVETDGKPYIVIGGGTYSVTTQGFDITNPDDQAEIRRQVAAEIKKLYVFEAENNPSDGGSGNWGEKKLNGEHVVNVLEDERFEIVCELSALKVGKRYGIHFNKKDVPDGEGRYDFNDVNFPSFTKLELTSLTVGTTKYEAFYKDENSGYNFSWNCLAVVVSDTREFGHTEVCLEKTDDKVYAVVSGKYQAYTKAEIEEMLAAIKADYSYNKELGNTIENVDIPLVGKIVTAVTEGENGGTYTIKLDITDAIDGTIFFHLDFDGGTTNFKCPLTQSGVCEAVMGTRKFTLFTTADTGSSDGWADGLVAVKIVDTNAKSYGVAQLVGFEEIDGKAYAVFSGDCTGYTADRLKSMITLIDFENSTDSCHKPQGAVYTVTVENGKYYIKCDISELTVIDDKDGKNGGYYMHVKPFGSGKNGDISAAGDIQTLVVGGYSYSAETCTITWDSGSWTGHIIKIRAV